MSLFNDVTGFIQGVGSYLVDTLMNNPAEALGFQTNRSTLRENLSNAYQEARNKQYAQVDEQLKNYREAWTGANANEAAWNLAKLYSGNLATRTDESSKIAQANAQRQVGVNKGQAAMSSQSNYERNAEEVKQDIDQNIQNKLEAAEESANRYKQDVVDTQFQTNIAKLNNFTEADYGNYAREYGFVDRGYMTLDKDKQKEIASQIASQQQTGEFFLSDEDSKNLTPRDDSALAVIMILLTLKDFEIQTDEDRQIVQNAIDFLRIWKNCWKN